MTQATGFLALRQQHWPGVKQVYKYNVDGSFSLDLYDDGTNLSIHENFFLNSSKLVDSTFQYDDTQDTTTEKYF